MRKFIVLSGLIVFLFSISFAQETQEFLIEQAQQKLLAGEYDDVFYFVNRAIKNDPNNPQLYVMKSMAKAGTDNITGAFQDLKQALKIDPGYELAYYNKGVLYSDYWGKYKKAIKEYDKAIELNSKYRDALYNRANCNYILENVDECLDDLDRIITYYPEDLGAYKFKVKIYMDKKDAPMAILNIEEAIKLDPENQIYYGVGGLLYMEVENKEKACTYFHKAFELGDQKAEKWIKEFCE